MLRRHQLHTAVLQWATRHDNALMSRYRRTQSPSRRRGHVPNGQNGELAGRDDTLRGDRSGEGCTHIQGTNMGAREERLHSAGHDKGGHGSPQEPHQDAPNITPAESYSERSQWPMRKNIRWAAHKQRRTDEREGCRQGNLYVHKCREPIDRR